MKSCGSEVFWPWHEVWPDRIGSEAFFVGKKCHDVGESGVVLACFKLCFSQRCRSVDMMLREVVLTCMRFSIALILMEVSDLR